MAAENRGPELAAVIIFLLAFTLVTVSLRCYTMAYLLKRFTAEDWLAVATQVSEALCLNLICVAFYLLWSILQADSGD